MAFTCRACALALASADEQRTHYRADLHRYNTKRRVAGLPPVSAAVFAHKIRPDDPPAPVRPRCEPCRKTFATENAYGSHLRSRKHADNALRPTPPPPPPPAAPATPAEHACLFCTAAATSPDDALAHMASAHSFFVPDADYLVDLPGLVKHLAEKIAVDNVCIYCNGSRREHRSLDAVRKHMRDKGHCKIAYDTEADRLALSDFYDFTASYPPASASAADDADDDSDAWEDVDHPTLGDTEYELVLPSGARIGHRSLMRYYAQSFRGIPAKPDDPNSGAALARRLLADKQSALVPRKGGFGAFGQGTHVVKARNRGEAREAGRHVREFRDQRRRQDFKTRVALVHNNQKHFRDPLLQ